MEITFLGTSSGVPTRSRNVSSLALKLDQQAEIWLFDCGEGTQHQFIRSDLRVSQVRRIFITHLHGDHIFGLMGLLATRGMAGNQEPVDLYGPANLDAYLKACSRYSHTRLSYGVKVHTVSPGLVYEDDHYQVTCLPLHHRVTAFGYRVSERDRPGTFDVAKAQALGIPSGPFYGQLKRGETITLADGRRFRGQDFLGAPKAGRHFVYCTDTVYCENAVELSRDADVLVHETTFAHQDAAMAFERLHSTSTMAAQVAMAARVNKLLMTHFSPRYAPGNALQVEHLLQEARAIFPNTDLAYDFLSYAIPPRPAGVPSIFPAS
ncbi:MAG: ribonuclease Z [Gloeomargaritaceae cyanobacterium C42_A2020_066]|nr:ribonuclease Z [Gloeomargaritaceae cyanobacterium C42_A2020_066]